MNEYYIQEDSAYGWILGDGIPITVSNEASDEFRGGGPIDNENEPPPHECKRYPRVDRGWMQGGIWAPHE